MTPWIVKLVLFIALLPALYFSGDVFLERSLFSAPPLWGNALGYLHEYGWSSNIYPSHGAGKECLLILLAQAGYLYFMWPSKTHRVLIITSAGLTGLSYVICLWHVRQYEPIIFSGPYLDMYDPVMKMVTKQWEQWDQRKWLLNFLAIALMLIALILPVPNEKKSAAL